MREIIKDLIVVLIIIFIFFVANIWITSLYIDVTYRFNKALKKEKLLSKENEKLKIEVKMLSSPERIIKIGKNKLHLDFVKKSQIYEVKYNE